MDDYPEKLLRRRREAFLREIKVKNTTGLSWGCFRNFLIILFLVILFVVFAYLWQQGIFIGI